MHIWDALLHVWAQGWRVRGRGIPGVEQLTSEAMQGLWTDPWWSDRSLVALRWDAAQNYPYAMWRLSSGSLRHSLRTFVRIVSVGSTSRSDTLPNAKSQLCFQRPTHL